MSSQPCCVNCGMYVMHGDCLCDDCRPKVKDPAARIAALEDMVAGHKKRIDHEIAARDRFRAKVAALEAELAELKGRRCETCDMSRTDQVDEPCDKFSEPFLAFMRDHCDNAPVYCSCWTAREEAGDDAH